MFSFRSRSVIHPDSVGLQLNGIGHASAVVRKIDCVAWAAWAAWAVWAVDGVGSVGAAQAVGAAWTPCAAWAGVIDESSAVDAAV